LTINIPDPNAKKAANDDPAKEKARVDVDLDLRLRPTLARTRATGATRKSGGSSSTKPSKVEEKHRQFNYTAASNRRLQPK